MHSQSGPDDIGSLSESLSGKDWRKKKRVEPVPYQSLVVFHTKASPSCQKVQRFEVLVCRCVIVNDVMSRMKMEEILCVKIFPLVLLF